MRSHRLHRFATLTVNRLLVIGLIGWVMVLGFSPSELGETPEPEVTIIKAPSAGSGNPYQQEYEEMLYPCVRIETAQGVGSGVVIATTDYTDDTDNTYILTAAHVVGDKSSVGITFYGENTATITATVVMTDTVKDLGLVKVDKPCPYRAKLAPRDYQAYLFTPVYAIGCSLGLPTRPSEGIITALEPDYWEISSPILPGNSGGGVFLKSNHQLIGIAVWVRVYQGQLITTMAGVVPISVIYDFLEEVESRE